MPCSYLEKSPARLWRLSYVASGWGWGWGAHIYCLQAGRFWAGKFLRENKCSPLFAAEPWEPVPLGQKGVCIGGQWTTGSRKKGVTSLGWGNGEGKGVPPSACFLHPFPRYPGHAPVSKGVPDFQWDRVSSVLPCPLCSELPNLWNETPVACTRPVPSPLYKVLGPRCLWWRWRKVARGAFTP